MKGKKKKKKKNMEEDNKEKKKMGILPIEKYEKEIR